MKEKIYVCSRVEEVRNKNSSTNAAGFTRKNFQLNPWMKVEYFNSDQSGVDILA